MKKHDYAPPLPVRVAKYYLIALLFFLWGISTVTFQVFPYTWIATPLTTIRTWLAGSAEGDDLSLSQKIQAEFFDEDTLYTGASKIDQKFGLSLQAVKDPNSLLPTRGRKLYYYSQTEQGYYIFFVTLNAKKAKFAALIVSAQGELKHVITNPRRKRKTRNLGQGGVSDYGHFIFNSYFDLHVKNICNETLLKVRKPKGKRYGLGEGVGFHHKASATQNDLWTWYGNQARRYDLKTQKMVQQFDLIDLIAANPQLPIFEARLIKSNKKGHIGQWKYQLLNNKNTKKIRLKQISLHDPFHQNDIDVLTEYMAPYFPQFEPGDLLLSFRSINLITVIHPQTLKVKWYSYGEFSRQHDPDWSYNGEIVLYDNQSHNLFSRIISINVENKQPSTLIRGREWGFYQFAQGNQHFDMQNRVLFTNNAEAVQINQKEIDFYFKYTNKQGKSLDIGTVHYIDEKQYQTWLSSCQK